MPKAVPDLRSSQLAAGVGSPLYIAGPSCLNAPPCLTLLFHWCSLPPSGSDGFVRDCHNGSFRQTMCAIAPVLISWLVSGPKPSVVTMNWCLSRQVWISVLCPIQPYHGKTGKRRVKSTGLFLPTGNLTSGVHRSHFSEQIKFAFNQNRFSLQT